MGDKSAIQWTDATWNPSTGCTKISPGCKNCYAERLSRRLKLMGNRKYKNGFQFTLHDDALKVPTQWKTTRKIFVNSMSDLFHESMPDDFLSKCFDVMVKTDWHVYQVLTKRPQRMLEFTKKYGKVPDHIWLGTSVESDLYKKRVDILRKVNCKIRFVSFEPILGSLGELNLKGISWAIAGGESGPHHRNVEAEWIREIRKQCRQQKVAFFFKQWGGRTPKSGGRELDGREWNQYPKFNIRKTEAPKCQISLMQVSV